MDSGAMKNPDVASGRPRIVVDCQDGRPQSTHVYAENGTEISSAIHRLVVDIDVQKPTAEAEVEAEVYAVEINGKLFAEVRDIAIKVLPPPLPKTQYRLTIGPPNDTVQEPDGSVPFRSYYRLEKLTPLPTYGIKEEMLAEGTMDPVGPMELVCDAPE